MSTVWGVFGRAENAKHCRACVASGKRCGNRKGGCTLIDVFASEEAAEHAIAVGWFTEEQLEGLYDPENRDWVARELAVRDK